MGRFLAKFIRLALTLPLASGVHGFALAQAPDEIEPDQVLPAIVVIGQRAGNGDQIEIAVQSELDENGIAAYGHDTVGDVLGEVLNRVAGASAIEPVILINGRLSSGVGELSDLPAEALSKIQLLPVGAAAQLGENPTRRVVNVAIKSNLTQITPNMSRRAATAGEGEGNFGDVSLLKLDGGNRRSFALKFRDFDPLFESDRGIISTQAGNLYDAQSSGTLLPQEKTLGASANFTQNLGAKTTFTLIATGDRAENISFVGANLTDLQVAPNGAAVSNRLEQQSRADSLGFSANLNHQLGRWRFGLQAIGAHRTVESQSERGFDATGLVALSERAIDRGQSQTDNLSARLSINGALFDLPAGPLQTSARLEWRTNRATSQSAAGSARLATVLQRDEALAQFSLQAPIFAPSSPIGGVGLELSGSARDVTAAGGLFDYDYGVNWQPFKALNLRASWAHEQVAAPANSLIDPVIVTDNVRSYDFIRQETVFVRYTTGGNPNILDEQRDSARLNVTLGPFTDYGISLTGEYAKIDSRDGFAALPPVNSDVQAAFPDRYLRDATGRLVAIDARPVGFDLASREQLNWGLNFSRLYGAPTRQPGGDLASGWRVDGSATHQWTLASERQARPGLPVVDLLNGGAFGYGGGLTAHQLNFNGGVTRKGIGLRLSAAWTGESSVSAGTLAAPDRLMFGARTKVDARIFANLGPSFPGRESTEGVRVSLEIDNLFDSRPSVRDSAGAMPLSYQPYLLEPLGRTVTMSVRKMF